MELDSISLDIKLLFLWLPTSILSREDTLQLVALKSCKELILTHDIVAWRLKSGPIWIALGGANTKNFQNFANSSKPFIAIKDLIT